MRGHVTAAVLIEFAAEPTASVVEEFALAGGVSCIGEAGNACLKDRSVGIVPGGVRAHGENVFLGGHGIAQAHASHAVDFGEGADNDQIGLAREPVEGAGISRVFDKVVVGLVNKNSGGAGDAGKEGVHFVTMDDGGGGVVGIADVNEAGALIAGGGHARKVVTKVRSERHFDRIGSGDAGVAQDSFKGWFSDDDALAGREKSHVGNAEDFARAATKNDVVRLHAMIGGNGFDHAGLERIGIASGDALRAGHGLAGAGKGPVWVLIGIELDDVVGNARGLAGFRKGVAKFRRNEYGAKSRAHRMSELTTRESATFHLNLRQNMIFRPHDRMISKTNSIRTPGGKS